LGVIILYPKASRLHVVVTLVLEAVTVDNWVAEVLSLN
jgi:hypothetical protein